MSKLTEQLRLVRVFNPHEFAGQGNVYISYYPNDNGRGGHSARWVVSRPGFIVDKSAAWFDHGNKSFVIFGQGKHAELKAAKLVEAQEWASAKYGIKEWAKTPFGSWMDAEFVKRRMKELKEQLKALAT